MGARLRIWWPKIKRPLLVVGIIAASALVIALVVGIIGGYLFNWDWTGLGPYSNPPHISSSDFQRGKTLWDWMQLLFIPVVLAVAGFLFNHRERKAAELRAEADREIEQQRAKTEQEIAAQRYEQDQHIALDKQREDLLQAYLDRMSELLLKVHLRSSEPDAEVRNVARVRTITILFQLDARRIGYVFAFLREAKLMSTTPNDSIVSLKNASLEKINFSQADLIKVNLTHANLSEANLTQANFSGATLSGATLNSATLSRANLIGANLSDANLRAAIFSEAALSRANFSGAILTNAVVSEEQLAKAKTLKGATMPMGLSIRSQL